MTLGLAAQALRWLPAVGAVGGALPGLRKGNLGEAALGSGIGALTGLGSVGGLGALTKSGMRMAGGQMAQNLLGTATGQVAGLGAQKAVMGALTPKVLTSAAKVGIPVLGAGAVFGTSGGLSGVGGQAAGNVLGAGASRLNQESNIVSMSALPQGFSPDHQRMIQGPQGNWWYQLNPGELPAGIRLGRELDADTGTSVLNKYANAQFGQTERVAKAEMERQAAATQLLANIQVAKNLVEMGAKSGHNIAEQATRDVGSAMANRQNFRYF